MILSYMQFTTSGTQNIRAGQERDDESVSKEGIGTRGDFLMEEF
jgi:hypothetical protein